jgi:hypothetical protein
MKNYCEYVEKKEVLISRLFEICALLGYNAASSGNPLPTLLGLLGP